MSPFSPVPEFIGHFGSTGTGLFFCEELDFYMIAALNQVVSTRFLTQLIIGIQKLIKKLGR